MPPALVTALDDVAAIMAEARDPWWVIGSAAVVLLGADTDVADVDVLLSIADADALGRRLPFAWRGDAASERFASLRYGRWSGSALPVEFMAALAVRDGERWCPIRPESRIACRTGRGTVYHPDRAEMIGILRLFGRSKDDDRRRLLEAVGNGCAALRA